MARINKKMAALLVLFVSVDSSLSSRNIDLGAATISTIDHDFVKTNSGVGVVNVTSALDSYISTLDPVYNWEFVEGNNISFPRFGVDAVVLNVTSQQWLTTDHYEGPSGAVWTHQVAVTIPKNLKSTKTALIVMTGGCNDQPVKPVPKDEEYLALTADISGRTGLIGVVLYQIPNCHLVFASDPDKKRRSEDGVMAWSWREFLSSTEAEVNPELVINLPMAKAAFACMKAVNEFTGNEMEFVVSGASKRGWTSWLVGSAANSDTCQWCPKVSGIAPLVPIVPYINHSVHLQHQSLGGFTFAFADYKEAGFLDLWETSPQLDNFLEIVDPGHNALYQERLAAIPKLAVVSSDDEFMQLDWTAYKWTDLPGEMHLLVIPNSEHSLSTGIPTLLPAITAFAASIAANETSSERPIFTHSVDETTGAISVTVPDGAPQPSKVVLRHAQTISKTRRDFRWVKLSNNSTLPCTWPCIKLNSTYEGGGNCLQPILWDGQTLHPAQRRQGNNSTTWSATPAAPLPEHWRGYFIELYFRSDITPDSDLMVSTPGYMWPNTLPFPDCQWYGPHADPNCSASLV